MLPSLSPSLGRVRHVSGRRCHMSLKDVGRLIEIEDWDVDEAGF